MILGISPARLSDWKWGPIRESVMGNPAHPGLEAGRTSGEVIKSYLAEPRFSITSGLSLVRAALFFFRLGMGKEMVSFQFNAVKLE